MKVVGRPKARSFRERFDRLQATVGAVAARPQMRRGTVLRFRTFEEFEAWKRHATRLHRASRNSAEAEIEFFEVGEVKIPFASKKLLWRLKQGRREKDQLDRRWLEGELGGPPTNG